MESSDGELEFLRQLDCGPLVSMSGVLYGYDKSHPDETVEIGSLVAMGVDLDAAAKDLNELLPLQLLRDVVTMEIIPVPCEDCCAVIILSFFDHPRLVVPIK